MKRMSGEKYEECGKETRQEQEQASGKKRKIFEIQQALNSDPVDIQILRKTARTVGGLLTDDIRRKVWPKLLSINIYDLPAKPGMRDDQREVLQEQLIDIILCILKRNPQLHYYQGYHDIVVTFLLVVGERMSIAMVEMLSTHHLSFSSYHKASRDFQRRSFEPGKGFYLKVLKRLYDAVQRKRPELWRSGDWLLHHGNSPAPTALSVRQFLTKNESEIGPHSPGLGTL
ncbi:TBC20 protein, partial [Polypterus senegalus]